MNAQETGNPLRARMVVVLKANDVIVAEVDDASLWNEVFATINTGVPFSRAPKPVTTQPPPEDATPPGQQQTRNPGADDPINKFAKELGIQPEVLKGACDPSLSEPYLRLDYHYWEQMKKDLPARGPNSVAPIVLAATLLCLWARHARIATITQAQAQVVLGTLNLRDPNASRGIKGSEWLQARPSGQVVLNPAQISKAVAVAACFCKQDWAAWKTS